MLVVSITADAHTQCVFSFGGRDLGRGTSLSVPVSLLRSRESSHNRPFLMESVQVDLVCGGRSQAQLRLPLSDLYPGPRSEGKYYKTSSTSEAYVIGRGYVYAEMVLQGCEGLAPLMSPRMQLCQVLPPSAHEYKHLYVGAGGAASPHDSLVGMLLLLPGPRMGEVRPKASLCSFRCVATANLPPAIFFHLTSSTFLQQPFSSLFRFTILTPLRLCWTCGKVSSGDR